MAIPTLEDFEDELVTQTDAILGDTISYKPKGGAFADIKARVEYGEALRDIATGLVIEQEIRVTISKAQASAKPDKDCRMVLPKVTGATFRPINVSNIGLDWSMGVERV